MRTSSYRKREEKVGFDHKILWFEGKNKTKNWLVFAFFNNNFLTVKSLGDFTVGQNCRYKLFSQDDIIKTKEGVHNDKLRCYNRQRK